MSQYLFTKWIGGDNQAFDEIYRLYYRKLLNFTTALIGNPAEGEDLTQETFIRLHKNRAQLSKTGITNGRALIYTIARRLAYKYSSYRQRWEKLSIQIEEIQNVSIGSEIPSPEALLLSAEIGVYIQTALDHLPEPQREVLLLRHRENLNYEEIAQIVGCSSSQVKARLHYARKLLRGHLKKMGIVPHSIQTDKGDYNER